MKNKRRFRIYYEDNVGVKYYRTQEHFSMRYSPIIERAIEFSPYLQVAKFAREQPEHIGAILHCEEII